MPKFQGGIKVDSKGYLTITAGPLRGKRLHTLIAEAMLGRELKPDEDVHHRDGNKLNCHWKNLQVLGKQEHGAVSARQAWYFRSNEIKAKAAWDRYFDQEETSFP